MVIHILQMYELDRSKIVILWTRNQLNHHPGMTSASRGLPDGASPPRFSSCWHTDRLRTCTSSCPREGSPCECSVSPPERRHRDTLCTDRASILNGQHHGAFSGPPCTLPERGTLHILIPPFFECLWQVWPCWGPDGSCHVSCMQIWSYSWFMNHGLKSHNIILFWVNYSVHW